MFKQVDLSQLQQGGNDNACQVTYDYMQAYFDFFEDQPSEGEPFAKARAIVKKYENYPIQSFKVIFKKIREQLQEIDEASQKPEGAINPDDDEDPSEEQKRQAQLSTKKKTPVIHEAKIEAFTGELTIESDNISQLTIKYYLIDAEILFSRSPFVKDQAEQFSYVKPAHKT